MDTNMDIEKIDGLPASRPRPPETGFVRPVSSPTGGMAYLIRHGPHFWTGNGWGSVEQAKKLSLQDADQVLQEAVKYIDHSDFAIVPAPEKTAKSAKTANSRNKGVTGIIIAIVWALILAAYGGY
jgi:hypothetical protein